MVKKKFYKCDHCGNVLGVLIDGGVTPICCGEPMRVLEPNTSDGAGEKHVPVIERNGKEVTVKIGEVEHPMVDEHYIVWVCIVQDDKTQKVLLHPGEKPEAKFTVDKDSPVTAYEYCNIHGLWMAEK